MNEQMHDLLEGLAGAGRALTSWCLITNLTTLTLLAIAIAADRLLVRRLAPAWRIVLYIPVFLRVVIPPEATWGVPFWKTAAPIIAAACAPGDPASSLSAACAAPAAIAPAATIAPVSLWPLAPLALYIAGIAWLAARWFRAARAVRTVLHTSQSSLRDRRVLISPSFGPLVAGLFRPCIVIPAWLASSEALPLILAHEKAHIARRDPVLAFTLRALCTLAWPVVPLWISASRVRALIEHACDDRALGAPEVRHQENVMKYARAMIDVAQRSTHLPGSLAFGAALRPRIEALRVARRWPVAIQMGIALAVPTLLIACSAARPVSQSQSQSRTEPTTFSAGILSTPAETAPAQLTPLGAAPTEADQRAVNVLVVRADSPLGSDFANYKDVSIEATERDALRDRVFAFGDTPEAASRIVVNVGQPATAVAEGGTMSMEFTVLPSGEGTVLATMSYAEGDTYTMKPTTLRFKKGEASLIRIPSSQLGKPHRTIVVTVDRLGEEPGC